MPLPVQVHHRHLLYTDGLLRFLCILDCGVRTPRGALWFPGDSSTGSSNLASGSRCDWQHYLICPDYSVQRPTAISRVSENIGDLGGKKVLVLCSLMRILYNELWVHFHMSLRIRLPRGLGRPSHHPEACPARGRASSVEMGTDMQAPRCPSGRCWGRGEVCRRSLQGCPGEKTEGEQSVGRGELGPGTSRGEGPEGLKEPGAAGRSRVTTRQGFSSLALRTWGQTACSGSVRCVRGA